MKSTEIKRCEQHMMDKLESHTARLVRQPGFRVVFAVFVPLVLFLGIAYLYRYGGGPNLIPKCPVYLLTGLYCPGCGGGRALYSILHGHILTALDFNPMFVLLLPFVAYLVLQGYTKVITGKNVLPVIPITLNQANFCTLVILLYTVARNIPVLPFSYLAP